MQTYKRFKDLIFNFEVSIQQKDEDRKQNKTHKGIYHPINIQTPPSAYSIYILSLLTTVSTVTNGIK